MIDTANNNNATQDKPKDSPVSSRLRREKSTKVVNFDARNISSVHTYHEEEKEGLVEYINGLLHNRKHVPINSKSNDIFDSIKDGVLLCRVVDAIQPGLIDDSRINIKDKLSIFEKGENLNLALQVAQEAFNLSFVNIGVEDLLEGRAVLVLSVLWQLITIDLRSRVRAHSREIPYLLHDEEDGAGAEQEEEDSTELAGEEYRILLRWVNHHLSSYFSNNNNNINNHFMDGKGVKITDKRVHNFSSDLKDSVAFVVLMHQLVATTTTPAPTESPIGILSEGDLRMRATLFLKWAQQINCNKFVSPDDILQGNARLNFAFIAFLFTKFNQPKLSYAKDDVIDGKLQAQAIELSDIHSQTLLLDHNVAATQIKIKEQERILAVEKEAITKEEGKLKERISSLENNRKSQAAVYSARIETLKQAVKQAQEQSQLPSVEDLTKAIEEETKEQQIILQEREVLREQMATLKKEVSERVEDRVKAEVLLQNTKTEIQELKTEHSAKTKTINEKIEALGIPALQKKLEEAINVNSAKTEQRDILSKTRETLSQKVEAENKAHSAASRAKMRVAAELEKAKKSIAETTTSKNSTVAATTRLERKLVEIKKETTQVKKDTLFVEYQTELATDSKEDVTKEIEKTKIESKEMNDTKIVLEKETDKLHDLVYKNKKEAQEQLVAVKTDNEKLIFENNAKMNTVIQALTTSAEIAADVLQDTKVRMERTQVAANMHNTKAEAARVASRSLIMELEHKQLEVEEQEKTQAKLEDQYAILQKHIKEEEREKEEYEKEIEELERQKVALEKINSEKHAKKQEVTHATNVKIAEANQTYILLNAHYNTPSL